MRFRREFSKDRVLRLGGRLLAVEACKLNDNTMIVSQLNDLVIQGGTTA